jgi:plastocyanin
MYLPALLILTMLLVGCGARNAAATVGVTLATASATVSSRATPVVATTATMIPTVVPSPTAVATVTSVPVQPTAMATRPAAASPGGTPAPAVRGTPAATTVEVRIKNFAFEPAMVTVPVGTTVVWRNTEGFHTVLSADFLLQSEPLDVGGTYSFTFTKPGTYPYECGIHPEMVAAIQVVP